MNTDTIISNNHKINELREQLASANGEIDKLYKQHDNGEFANHSDYKKSRNQLFKQRKQIEAQITELQFESENIRKQLCVKKEW